MNNFHNNLQELSRREMQSLNGGWWFLKVVAAAFIVGTLNDPEGSAEAFNEGFERAKNRDRSEKTF